MMLTMWMAAFTLNAQANDLYDVEMAMWSYANTAFPAKCWIRSYYSSVDAVTQQHYVDFYVGRASAPPLGEFGDFWLIVNPGAPSAGLYNNLTGVFTPLVERFDGGWDHWFWRDGVGEVKWSGNEFKANIAVNDDPAFRWWDVNINGDGAVAETDFSNNHAEMFTDCF